LAACLAVSAGCTRTVVGGFSDSPDKKYRVYVRIYGAYGRAFIENTAKKVFITIVENGADEKVLLKKGYRLRGSDLGCLPIWDKQHNLTVIVYDYGPGVIAMGSATVMFAGIPAARKNDMTAHAGCVAPIPSPVGKVISASSKVIVGG